jgi:hypothetical protein
MPADAFVLPLTAWPLSPLPRSRGSRFLSSVTEPWFAPTPTPRAAEAPSSVPSTLQRGIAAGLVAAAAIIGLLIGIGRRAGTAFRPLNATAYAVIGTRADGVWGFGHVTIIGVLVVLALSAVAGILVAWLSPSQRTLRELVAAAGVALLGYFVHVHLAARIDGGLSALLSLGELRALYITLASALVLGMRLAFSQSASARRF